MDYEELEAAVNEFFGVNADDIIREGSENMDARIVVGELIADAQTDFGTALEKWADREEPTPLPIHHVTSVAYELLSGAAFLFSLAGVSSIHLSSAPEEENVHFAQRLTGTFLRDCKRIFSSALTHQLKSLDMLDLLDPNAEVRAEIMKDLQD